MRKGGGACPPCTTKRTVAARAGEAIAAPVAPAIAQAIAALKRGRR
jgi:hypothetical protein